MKTRIALAALVAAIALAYPARATLTSTSNTVTYIGNAVTTSFTVPFKFLQNSDLVVTVAGAPKILNSDYTVSGAGNATGTVKFTTAPATSAAVVITRAVDYLQRTSLAQNRTPDPHTVESALDKLAMGEQQLQSLFTNPPASILPANVTAKLNGIRFADQFANIQAAITDAGTTGSVLIPASYIATDSWTNPNNIPILDLRGGAGGWRGVLNVKDFGAKGDGTTNDTGTVQAAVTAAAGKTLRFPQGTYKLTSPITLSSGTRLFADGVVTLNQTTVGAIVFYGSGVSNIEVRGFTITGAGSATQPTTGTSNNCGAICFETSGGNILVERNTISGFFNGITGTTLTGFTVRGNEVSHWRFYAVLASQSSDFHVDNNRLHDNDMPTGTAWSAATTYALGDTATANSLMWMSLHAANLNNTPPAGPPGDTHWLQIATYMVMATGGRPTTPQSRNTITDNKGNNNPMWDGIMAHDCDGLIITGNDMRGVRNGIDLSSAGSGKYVDKIVITDNYFESTATDAWSGAPAKNSGIVVFGPDATNKARNAVISNNVINGFNAFNAGTLGSGGVSISNADGVTIVGNRIYGVNAYSGNAAGGIEVNGTANGLVISSNSVETASGLAAIFITSVTTADTISITGNTLRDGNGTANAVKINGPGTIGSLSITGNTTNSTLPYTAISAPTISALYVDWQSTNNLFSKEGGTGATVQKMVAPSIATNYDLVKLDLSSTATSSMAVEVEVTGIISQTTGLVKWTYTAYGTRTGSADAVWTPAVATSMFVASNIGGNPANALGAVYGAVTAPMLIINQTSPSIGTLQFQAQTGAAYFIRARATAFRSIATPL